MNKVNALKLRQNLGAVLDELKRTGEPILLERGRVPVGVIISLADYERRFVDEIADRRREELVARIKSANLDLPKGTTSLDLIREQRR